MNDDFIALARANLDTGEPGTARWSMWAGAVLRGAGFPVSQCDYLASVDLARAADRALAKVSQSGRTWPAAVDLTEYDALFSAAVEQTSAAIADLAAAPLFREALTWQNPQFVRTCVDRLDSAPRERRSKQRKQETAIAGCVQRYTTKNDSIGFFGPVGWVQWTPQDPASSLAAGPGLVRRRTVYFEAWAIDEVAATLATRPELIHGVPPRRSPAILADAGRVVRPNGHAEPLSAEWARILELCDGVRPVRAIASAPGRSEDWLLVQLALMGKSGLTRMDLVGPIESHPERRLAQRLSRVPDPVARQGALADLGQLVAAKDEVAAAAGDPKRLAAALDALAARFECITGSAAVHRPGEAYAGRTIAYEDCVRDVTARLGADVLASLSEPLTLVLDSARWLANTVGEVYLRLLDERYERICQRLEADSVPLGRLLATMTRDFYVGDGVPLPAAGVVGELQRRWSAILAIPDGARHHQVDPALIGAAVSAAFASGPPQWSGGLRHAPDILIDAESVGAINRGDYQLVLGELHTAVNTVERAALVEQSDHKDRLRAMARFATGPGRIVMNPSRDWDYVARTRPSPIVLSSEHTYWTASSDDVAEVTAQVIPAGALEVRRVGRDLVVRCVTDARTFALAEVIGDSLSEVLASSFRLLPPRRHSPRVSIGRLVVSRETWRLPPKLCDWAQQQDERRRFLQMRQWVAKHGLPRRVFCVVPGEGKPVYVDFTSVPLTNSLASMLRKLDRDDSLHVTFSEMLPGPGGCWLKDARGDSYVSELRLVVSERTDG